MFSVSKPTDIGVRQFINSQKHLAHSYTEIGATRDTLPLGYDIDHSRVYLGIGRDVFEKAKMAIRQWEMFNLGRIQLCWPTAPIIPETTVAVLARVFGFWVLNACRIVYVIDNSGPIETFGFAYGTLPDHVERGEERFTVQWDHSDDSIWYDILAFSRPNHPLTWLGYLYVRRLQKQFARDSRRAMLRAVLNNG